MKDLIVDFCRDYGGEETRSTYTGELNYQTSRIFPFVLPVGCAWLPYIPADIAFGVFAQPALIVALRIGLLAAAMAVFFLRFVPAFRTRPAVLVPFFLAYILCAGALITGLSGGNASYIGGFLFLIMALIIPPVPVRIMLGILVVGLALFFTTAFLCGFNPSSPAGRYAVTDICSASIVSALFIIVLNNIRRTTWTGTCASG